MTRIVTVCLGNICRSPFAAVVLEANGGGNLEVRSAGLVDKWVGQGAHPQMVAAALDRGYDLTRHRGVLVTPELLRWADVVLAMDTAVLGRLTGFPELADCSKAALYLGEADVPDPYGKSDEAFAACATLIEAAVSLHLPD